MIFHESRLAGAFLIDLELHVDARGFFARSFCAQEFAAHGLATRFVQSNVSFNAERGTLRGMHWQTAPHAEAKLVRCTAGALFDVIVDLRRGSPTRLAWAGYELDARNRRLLYVPEGFAHGFITLEPATEIFYEMSAPFVADASRGFRWDDPAIGIEWPLVPHCISDPDATLAHLTPEAAP